MISVLRSNGEGGYAVTNSFVVGTQPVAVQIGNFNLDSFQDIAVVNRGVGSVSILLNNGNSQVLGFDRTDVSVGSNPVALAISSAQDIVVANEGDDTLTWLKNNVTSFIPVQISVAGCSGPSDVGIFDFDGDGDEDVVLACSGSNQVTFFANMGDMNFVLTSAVDVGVNPVALDVGNYNSDAWMDVVVANRGSSSVSVLTGQAGGVYNVRNITVGQQPRSVEFGAIDSATGLDIVVSAYQDNILWLLIGPSFESNVVSTGAGPRHVDIADYNGDARNDVSVVNEDGGSVSLFLLNVGAGGVITPPSSSSANLSQGAILFATVVGTCETLFSFLFIPTTLRRHWCAAPHHLYLAQCFSLQEKVPTIAQ